MIGVESYNSPSERIRSGGPLVVSLRRSGAVSMVAIEEVNGFFGLSSACCYSGKIAVYMDRCSMLPLSPDVVDRSQDLSD